MMNYKFLKIKTTDEVLALLKEFNGVFIEAVESRVGDLEQYSLKLVNAAEVYILKDDNTILGTVIFYANDYINWTSYLTMIAVREECRGKGIGSLLLAQCEDISRAYGMKHLKLEVDLRNNNAIEFYIRKGYKVLEEATVNTTYMIKGL